MKSLLVFWAPWASAMLEPAIEAAVSTLPVRRVNVDEDLGSAQDYQVMQLPTVFLIEEGKGMERLSGASRANTARIYQFAGFVPE